ncbi:hypothetical protein CHI07_03785 [Paenibacillus sp. 7884-2]|nr:hypothetical protein CHI07_03785 [Paenibacillus sp. 7884-2]
MSNKRNAFYFSLLTFILLMLAQIAFPFQTHAEPLNEIETEVETEDLDTYQEHPSEVNEAKIVQEISEEKESHQPIVENDLVSHDDILSKNEDKIVEKSETEKSDEVATESAESEEAAIEGTQPEMDPSGEDTGDQEAFEENTTDEDIDEERQDTLDEPGQPKDEIEESLNNEKESVTEESNEEIDLEETPDVEQAKAEDIKEPTDLDKKESDTEKAAEEKSGSIDEKKTVKPSVQKATAKTFSLAKAANTTSNYFKVTTNNLTVYDNRGDGPLKPIGKLKKDQVYSIVSDYGNWWRVQFGDIYGYVKKSDTVLGNKSEINNLNKSYSNTDHKYKANQSVTVYDNTSGSLVPFGELNKGTIFPIATDYGNWWRVIFLDRVGYVRKSEGDLQYAAFQDYFRADKNLPIYDNRGNGPLKQVGEVEKGQVYQRVSDYGSWHRIQFGDFYGYVEKFETTPDNGKSIKNKNKDYTNTKHHFKSNQKVTVYDNTSGSLEPFGKLDKGTVFPIATEYGNWWRIVLADRVGYIRKSEGDLQHAKFNNYFKADQTTAIYDNRGSGPLQKVGEVIEGQEYSIVSDYGNWHRIQFGDIYGYVRKFDTTPTIGNSIKNKNKSYTNTSRDIEVLQKVTVYDNTSGSLVPFASLDKGTIFPIATDYGSWWRIVLADRVGYVSKNEVKAEFKSGDKYFRVHQNNLPVYDNRGSGPLEKVGSLQKDQVFSIVSDYGNWWRVQFGDIYGYVKKSDTGYATGSEIKNKNKSYTNSSSKLITKNQVTVYDNTSGKLVAMGKIDKDITYAIATDYGSWWRVIYLDRVGYVNKADVDIYGVTRTSYGLTLEEALNMQMNVSPQTDSRYAYVSKTYIDSNNRVTASTLNVRSGPGVSGNSVVGQLSEGTRVNILGETNGWYQIEFNHGTWVNASEEDVLYYLDPTNFINDSRLQFQFLDLSKTSDAVIAELNKYLSGKGTLSGQAQAFKDASKVHGVNDIYLISHAILETGHGGSTLAQGVMYNGVKVYNMYGVGAYDSCPIECGAKKAYEEGWTTPYKAIVGGASFIGNNYIKAGQNTLYKMRWNPEGMDRYGYATHQYATDIGWASKQVYTMYNLYQDLNLISLHLDIPVYEL